MKNKYEIIDINGAGDIITASSLEDALKTFREFISPDLIAEVKIYKYEKIYTSNWARDCDMCEKTTFREFDTRKDYEDFLENEAEWAEGPSRSTEISEEEYNECSNQPNEVRDRIMEAYEDGRGFSIIV